MSYQASLFALSVTPNHPPLFEGQQGTAWRAGPGELLAGPAQSYGLKNKAAEKFGKKLLKGCELRGCFIGQLVNEELFFC